MLSLKPYWDKSHIISVPPQKMAISGGITFSILRWCNGLILLKIFLVRIWGRRIFLMEFSADRPKFRPKIYIWNSKIWRNFEKKKKKQHFFFSNVAPEVTWCLKKKKKVSVVERVFKKLQKNFHQSWSTFHVKILVQRHYVFLTLEKNTKIFIFFSPPEKCEKMSKNKNFKKK